jgi:energy-coupling factor transporter ATP-binding protein EcfA2
MTGRSGASAVLADPFGESRSLLMRRRLPVLGGRFEFESNSRALMRLVDSAYAGLPAHRISPLPPTLRVRLLSESASPWRRRTEPPPLSMHSGPGMLGGATNVSNLVVVSPEERSALVVVSPQMLRFSYHVRYEMVEFAVFTLAARALGLVPLHAACVARRGRGVLLMGPSGSGKSTIALQSLLAGLDFLAEDGVFVGPDTLLATGVANFLHVRSDSLRWIERRRDAAEIRRSPMIKRRSGVKKYEVDLRRPGFRLAARAPAIVGTVFLSPQRAGRRPLLRRLEPPEMLHAMRGEQAYAAGQPGWSTFAANLARLGAFELRRGRHPREGVDAIRTLLESAR